MQKRIETTANVVLIVAGLLFCFIVAHSYFAILPSWSAKHQAPEAGDKLSGINLDWAGNKKTLVMVLRQGCHFCEESLPFYRHILGIAKEGKNVHIVIAMDLSSDNGLNYLRTNDLNGAEFVTSSPTNVNVSGTPTLILVNNEGVVVNRWIGKLKLGAENEVMEQL
jgi:hypothetical protein